MPAGWVSAAVAVYGAVTAGDGSSSGGGSSEAAERSAQISQDQWNYYRNNYQPLETSLIDQAQKAGSPEEFSRARGAANADVTNSFNQAQKQTQSRLQSYGINPGSPAYSSATGSVDLAQGAAKAGALTAADNSTRNLAYSKALDVVGLGRNIPAQSAASAGNASIAAANAEKNNFYQNQQNQRAQGRAASAIGNIAGKWFNNNTTAPTNANSYSNSPNLVSDSYTGMGGDSYAYAKGGKITPISRYAKGGLVDTKPITPHMRFAQGGGVGRQGMEEMPDNSNMGDASQAGKLNGPGTPTSDSIPAVIDGQQPAALSTDEFVINADAVKMSGEDMLKAINEAGLKRRTMGLEEAA